MADPQYPPLRVLHLADTHIGMENYGRLDPQTGLNSRVMDFLRRLSDAVEYALDHETDLCIFAGDAYKTRDPNSTLRREFSRRIKRLADVGIPVIMLVGNHDLPAVPTRASSVEIFHTLDVPNITVADREELHQLLGRRGQPVQIATVPYPMRSRLLNAPEHKNKSLAELDRLLTELVADNIRSLAQEAAQRPNIPTILTGHFSVSEAQQGSEQSVMVGRDVIILRSELANESWDYVALGHIHKHQELNRGAHPPIVYCGSLERIDFGEEKEDKGWVVAEVARGNSRWEFVRGYRRFARPFTTIRVDARGADAPTEMVVAAIRQHELRDAVVRIIVRLTAHQEGTLDDRAVRTALDEAGVSFVAAVQRDVERIQRGRVGAGTVEELPPLELLGRYLEYRQVPEERRERLYSLAEGIFDEARQESGG